MMDNVKYDLVIRGGHVIDPALGFGADTHIFIKEGAIVEVVGDSEAVQKRMEALDADRVIEA